MKFIAYRVCEGGMRGRAGALLCRPYTEQEHTTAKDSTWVVGDVHVFEAPTQDAAWREAERRIL